ncbi:MAG TPA: HAD-IC family P-type ATPase [Novosphingobium sp.]|nr:HAD-IC family P-type ATPase [Novosphingobium sp.]
MIENQASHTIPDDDLVAMLQTRRDGLASAEAQARLERIGPNSLPPPTTVHPLRRFLAQFNNALIYFLLAGAVAAALLNHVVDAAVILAVVLVNAVVGFLQEGKAERALGAIRDLISPSASVMRDGERRTVPAVGLVPGDVVLIDAGDRVPADLRILRSHGLTIDEALLTGESVTAQKHAGIVPADAALGDQANMAFSGTLVTTGQATGLVVATGTGTQIGRISSLLGQTERVSTPLLRQIDHFAHRFTLLVMVAAAALLAFSVWVRGYDWTDALISVVALSVGVIPEGLPAVITITLAIGVQRMAARNAVVRQLPAVETLGATSIICTDKTGTLTLNEMTVRHVLVEGHRVHVDGTGLVPQGSLTAENHDDDASAIAAVEPILACGLLCNDAVLRERDGAWSSDGDPMEGALVSAAMKAGFDAAHHRGEWPRLDQIPFDAVYRYMATLHEGPGGECVVYVKGAPEAILAMTGETPAGWDEPIASLAREGERVLGFGVKRLADGTTSVSQSDLLDGVTFLGLMGFIDPPRAEAVEAVAQCRSAGIAVKMITGDHVATALAIARQIGLADDPEAVTGADVDALDDDALVTLARRASVFARTSPEHKLRIVRALQTGGSVVAMTGDGVNDAPSLKQAGVGIAMGRKGTEAAKEAAEIVLLDDNFASIVAAVNEGRTVYDNIRKVVSWTLPTNGGETVGVIVAILAGFALPMTATQILWINLLLASTLGLVLAFEPPEPGVMARPPRDPRASLLSPFLLWRVLAVSVLFGALSLAVYFAMLGAGRSIEAARTMVVDTLVVAEMFYLFSVRFLHMGSLTWRGALGTPVVLGAIAVVVVAQLLFTYAPFMHAIFHSAPLTLTEGLIVIGLGAALFLVLELEKLVFRRLGWFEELNP